MKKSDRRLFQNYEKMNRGVEIEAYRRRRKSDGGLNGVKEGLQVAITGLVVAGVFHSVIEHGSEPTTVEPPHGFSGGRRVLAGTEVLVKGVPQGPQYGAPDHAHMHELGLHDPRPDIHHGLDGRGVEVCRGA